MQFLGATSDEISADDVVLAATQPLLACSFSYSMFALGLFRDIYVHPRWSETSFCFFEMAE